MFVFPPLLRKSWTFGQIRKQAIVPLAKVLDKHIFGAIISFLPAEFILSRAAAIKCWEQNNDEKKRKYFFAAAATG